MPLPQNSLLSSFLRKTAAATESSGKYPFLPAGDHRQLQVKNFFVLAGGNNGDTLILEVRVLESSNPEAEGKIHSVVCGLNGNAQKQGLGFGNMKSMQNAMIGSLNGSELTEPVSEEEMAELGLIGLKAGPNAPAGAKDVESKAPGLIIASNSVRVLKKDQKLPMTEDNSYVRHNWQPVFKKAE